MKAVIISDIHIYGADDPLYEALLKLMRGALVSGDQLVLAGDIFDFMVGKQARWYSRYAGFFSALTDLGQRGISVAYIEGNHDFHLHEVFSEYPFVQVFSSETMVTAGKKRLYVAHGDLVDRGDWGYLFLRFFFRSAFIRFAARVLPEVLVEWIGTHSADSSRRRNPRLPESRGEDRLAFTRKGFRNFAETKFQEGFDAIVLGHCHDHDGVEFRNGPRIGQYLNVGFPRVHQTYVEFSEGGGLVRKDLV